MFEIEEVKKVVVDAGDAIMELYGEAKVFEKEENNPVTEADFLSNKILCEGLGKFGYPVLSEEEKDDLSRLEAEKVWIIDPLDGTKDFIQQTDEFSVMVGLVENGECILGVVYQSAKKRLFYAERGKGAFLEMDGEGVRKLGVSAILDFSRARMLISRNHLLELEQKVSKELGIVNLLPCGSAGLKSSIVAAGEADLYMNTSDKTYEWDICAASIIIEEAGGKITDMEGGKIVFNKEDPRNLKGFVVSNGVIHDRVVEVLN